MNEFDVITKILETFDSKSADIMVGNGDDAFVTKASSRPLITCADAFALDRHFTLSMPPEGVAYRGIAANVSDVCAMGGLPTYFTLCLSMPEIDEAWVSGFMNGIKQACRDFNVKLMGGDLIQAPLQFSVQMQGELYAKSPWQRSGAQVGDDIWVTGKVGLASIGLEYLLKASTQNTSERPDLEKEAIDAFLYPQPPVNLIQPLADIGIHAAIDLSDGLSSELNHLAKKSATSLLVDIHEINQISTLSNLINYNTKSVLTGGEDFQLLFTAPKSSQLSLITASKRHKIHLTKIGEVIPCLDSNAGVYLTDKDGRKPLNYTGYKHFNEE